MNARKHWVTLVVASIGVVLISSSAVAGSKQRHRWEGVAIGIGAAILGHAIYQSHTHHSTSPVVVVDPDRPCRRGPKHRHGHWEWRESWVPAVYERVWNPGHYKP
jgi:hypothetical protein